MVLLLDTNISMLDAVFLPPSKKIQDAILRRNRAGKALLTSSELFTPTMRSKSSHRVNKTVNSQEKKLIRFTKEESHISSSRIPECKVTVHTFLVRDCPLQFSLLLFISQRFSTALGAFLIGKRKGGCNLLFSDLRTKLT